MIHSNQIILLILVLSSLISCNSQVKIEDTQPGTKTFERSSITSELDNEIWVIHQNQNGIFWFGSNGNGVYQLDGKELKQYTVNDGLVDNQIRGIQEDSNGHIYLETPSGVSKFDGTKFITLKILEPTNSKWKNNPTDLWFNCNGNHLYRFDGESLHDLQLPEMDLTLLNIDFDKHMEDLNYSPYSVYGIDKDKEGNIWFGTVKAGAFRFDGKSFLWIGEQELSTLPDGRVPGVRSMIQDNDGYLWLSNFYSKYKITPGSPKGYEKLKATSLPKDIIQDKILYFNSGISDHEGNLWMTTYSGGVWKYDGNALSNQEIHNGKETVLLVSIYEDNNGTIWLGTNNDGVYKQNGQRFEKFKIDNTISH